MSLFWELYQQRQISDARSAAADAGRAATRRDALLESRMDALVLANMAMWSFLQEKHGYTDDDLLQRMQQIDLSDGRLDGKVSPTARPCPMCKRMVAVRGPNCLYCGAQIGGQAPFAQAQ